MNKLGDCFFVMQVLQDFPNATANVSFEYLFDLIPTLQPRAFSIASSMQVGIDVHVCVLTYM